jgi:tripartite-type tricarboxylate transporter receptor subunit TctC
MPACKQAPAVRRRGEKMKFALSPFLLAALAAALTPAPAAAQPYPARPVTVVMPYNAGNAPDMVARFMAQDLSERLGQRFLVENRTGASGNLGAMQVAKAAPDGYTLLLSTPNPVGFNKLMGAQIQFDPETDFTPVAVIAKSPQLIVAHVKTPANNLKELIDYARANPGKLNVGIPGTGTTSHIALEYLLQLSGTQMSMVPYRSSMTADLLSGQIDVGVGLVPSYVGAVNTGQLRGLAVTSRQRSAQLPDVPTAEEAGFPGFEATAWYVLVAPSGTPKEAIATLNKAVNEYIASAKAKEQFHTLDMLPVGGTPEEAKAFLASEVSKWGPLIAKAKIRM